MFVQDHHSLEELQRLTKALRLETGTQLVIDSSCVPVSTPSCVPVSTPPPAISHSRLRVRRPGIGSAWHASHATKCYIFPACLKIWKTRFWRKFLMNRWLWLYASGCSFDDNERNCMIIKELRHSQ